MSGLRENLIPIIANGFDIEQGVIAGQSHLLILLQYNGTDVEFNELFRFFKGLRKTSDQFRQKSKFEIATLENLYGITKKVSHISYNGLVYSINQADIEPPDNDRWTWLFYGSVTNKQYVPLDVPIYTTPEGIVSTVINITEEFTINANTLSFSLQNTPVDGFDVFYNGVLQKKTDFVLNGLIVTSSFVLLADSSIIVKYKKVT